MSKAIPITLHDVYARLRTAIKQAGSQSDFCRKHFISTAYVSDVMNGRRDPGEKILRALGLKKSRRFYEERPASADKTA